MTNPLRAPSITPCRSFGMKNTTAHITAALILIAAVAFNGCAAIADAGSSFASIGKLTESTSTFNGKRTISVSPAPLYDPNSWMGVPFFLGAEWNEEYPETIGMVLQYKSSTNSSNMYVSFYSLKINVDGKTYSFDSKGNTNYSSGNYNTVSNRIYTKSQSVIPIPYDLFNKMMASNKCTIRIGSSEGSVDALFSQDRIPGGQGTAKHYMIKMADRIEGK